jgi:hypothetical protein
VKFDIFGVPTYTKHHEKVAAGTFDILPAPGPGFLRSLSRGVGG